MFHYLHNIIYHRIASTGREGSRGHRGTAKQHKQTNSIFAIRMARTRPFDRFNHPLIHCPSLQTRSILARWCHGMIRFVQWINSGRKWSAREERIRTPRPNNQWPFRRHPRILHDTSNEHSAQTPTWTKVDCSYFAANVHRQTIFPLCPTVLRCVSSHRSRSRGSGSTIYSRHCGAFDVVLLRSGLLCSCCLFCPVEKMERTLCGTFPFALCCKMGRFSFINCTLHQSGLLSF